MASFTTASSKNILLKEYKNLAKEKWVKIDVSLRHILFLHNADADNSQMDEEDIYRWNLALIVLNPDSLYYGGYFKAQINFPRDYPYKPPGKSHHFGLPALTNTAQISASQEPYGILTSTPTAVFASQFYTHRARIACRVKQPANAGPLCKAWSQS